MNFIKNYSFMYKGGPFFLDVADFSYALVPITNGFRLLRLYFRHKFSFYFLNVT